MSEETTIGYVYILENASMPGLIKIGKTSRDSFERARELSSTTGVPTPFKVAFKLSSAKYEQLEKEMHSKLADHRVTSNREFFKYPVNKAISLLKKLDTQKQDDIGPGVVRGEKNIITRLSNFFGQFFPLKSNKRDKTKPDNRKLTEIEVNGESVKPTSPVMPLQSSVNYIIKDRSLQNEYRDNTVDVNLNGSEPYYSEQNGFYWAANHQGIAECVPQHIKRIIHNEELEIASTRDELEQEINDLREEVVELEGQKSECEREIGVCFQELAEKKEELAGLEVQLKALVINRLDPFPAEAIPDDSNPELFNAVTVEDIPNNPVTNRFEEEINNLLQEKADLEQAIEEKNQVWAEKKEEFVRLEVELQGPTETELNLPSETADQVGANKQFSWISRIPVGLVAFIATIVLIALSAYLFIFYASAVDKAFFLNEEAIQKRVDEGTYAGIQDIVNPAALSKTFQNRNYFVLFFPCIFLGFALALDHFWESGKRGWVIGLAILTFVFDFLLAIHISLKIYLAEKYIADRTSQEIAEWTLLSRDNILNVSTVIFCGFVASLLVSVLYKVTRERWQKVQSSRPQLKEDRMRDIHIKAEKMQREARAAGLNTEMENLQSEIKRLKGKNETIQQKVIKTVKTPIESQIAVLKVQTDNLESTNKQLNNSVTTFQQKIDKRLARIEEASSYLNRRVVNRNKMESQVNQFLNGWCRFVAHSRDETLDVSDQIDRIKQVANDTLNYYYQDSPDYSSQP